MRVKNPCPKEWDLGTWPFTTKCVLGKLHKGACVDRYGRIRPESEKPGPIIGAWMLGHE